MTKSKNTKRALLASVRSFMLCAAMLVGSTFAWFTDSVTSGKNKIVAGNLDIEVEYCLDLSAEGAEWSEGEKADSTSTVTTISGNTFNYTAGDDHGHAIALNTIGVSTDYSALTITGNTFNNKGVEACSALLIYNDDTNAVVLPTYSDNREVHATLETNNNGTWNKVSKTDRAYVEMIFGDRVSYSNNNKLVRSPKGRTAIKGHKPNIVCAF